MEIITGKILEVPFVNKGGRLIEGVESLFLEVGTQQYFIKIQAGKVSRQTLKELLGQSIKLEGEIANGLWDSDDPNIQSRIGEYVVIFKILV
jgi:hypothetical protein